MKKIIAVLLLVLLVGCGSTHSLNRVNLINYGIIKVSESVTLAGVLTNETEVDISIVVDGAEITYSKDQIIKYKISQMPRSDLMQRDIVQNTAATSNILSVFVAIGVLSAALIVFQ